jgi:hypothetical protein
MVSQKLMVILGLRAGDIPYVLLFCYPRLTSVDDGSLKLLNRSSFRKSLMVLHTADSVYVWAADEAAFQREIGLCVTQHGLTELDLMKGPKAEAVRGIVRAAWELSLGYLIVLPLIGLDAVAPFLADEKATDRCRFPVWVRRRTAELVLSQKIRLNHLCHAPRLTLTFPAVQKLPAGGVSRWVGAA